MKSVSLTIIALMLVVLLPTTLLSSAQFDGQSWEVGWITDVDGNYEVEMEDDWDIFGELVIFVENSRQNELNVNFELEWDVETPFLTEGPDSGTIAAGGNVSFTFTLTENSALDVRNFSPSDTFTLTLKADEVVSQQTVSSQEIDAGVAVPKVFNLQPDDAEDHSMYSDTWIEVNLLVSNWGNDKDAVSSGEIEIRSCPNLKVEGMEQFDNLIVEPTGLKNNVAQGFDVKFIASASHPDRTCEITFSVISEGDERVRSTTFNIVVSGEENNAGTSGGENDSIIDDGLSENSSELPAIGFYEIFSIILLALIFSRRDKL